MRRIFGGGGMDRSLLPSVILARRFNCSRSPGVPKAGGGLGTNRAGDPVQPLGESFLFGFAKAA